jgi:lipoprotein-anchoring transpeptidase ErfK/SrfK
MRARLLAALFIASALTAAGAASAQASDPSTPDSSSTSVASSTSAPESSSTTTTALPGEDAVVPETVPPVPIGGPGSAGGPATRTGTTMLVGEQPAPPSWALPPENSGTGRRAIYSISQMRVWAVEEDGTVVKTHRVSGKAGMPDPGEYSVWSRSLYTYSAGNPNIRWQYMVRFAWTPRGGNIGFHEIPRDCGKPGCPLMQTDEQLGEALSGGCVRQSREDAIWMWDWAQLGTKVVVLP